MLSLEVGYWRASWRTEGVSRVVEDEEGRGRLTDGVADAFVGAGYDSYSCVRHFGQMIPCWSAGLGVVVGSRERDCGLKGARSWRRH